MSRLKYKRHEELKSVIWRNVPPDGYVGTYSTCPTCKKRPGRGGGQCAECAADALGELVGRSAARLYLKQIRNLRELERIMESKARGTEDLDK